MKIKKLLLSSIIIIIFISFSAWFLTHKSNTPQKEISLSPSPTVTVNQQVTLSVVFGDKANVVYSKYLNGQELTAFSLLKEAADAKKLTMDTQQYSFGVFVKSIESYKSGANKSWIYFVNGKSGTIAADKYTLMPGDKVEWKYLEPSGE